MRRVGLVLSSALFLVFGPQAAAQDPPGAGERARPQLQEDARRQDGAV